MRVAAIFALTVVLLLGSKETYSGENANTGEEISRKADYLVFIARTTRSQNGAVERKCLSGFLIKHGESFYVVTAGHVQPLNKEIMSLECMVRGAVENKLPRRYYRIELIGIDRTKDVGVLKIIDSRFRYEYRLPEFESADSLQSGDVVYSLGHPYGRMWQISSGRVLATRRRYGGNDPLYKDFSERLISHTGWTANGSSGGPLLNEHGEIVGMNILRVRSDRPPTSSAIPAVSILESVNFILNKNPSK